MDYSRLAHLAPVQGGTKLVYVVTSNSTDAYGISKPLGPNIMVVQPTESVSQFSDTTYCFLAMSRVNHGTASYLSRITKIGGLIYIIGSPEDTQLDIAGTEMALSRAGLLAEFVGYLGLDFDSNQKLPPVFKASHFRKEKK